MPDSAWARQMRLPAISTPNRVPGGRSSSAAAGTAPGGSGASGAPATPPPGLVELLLVRGTQLLDQTRKRQPLAHLAEEAEDHQPLRDPARHAPAHEVEQLLFVQV